MESPGALEGQVAVVTGAARHAGRGIAIELGMAGATVICTGRSVRGKPSERSEPGAIDETAEMIRATGGSATWIQVDHTDIDQVRELFRRVTVEHGRLDLLVNSVSGRSCNEPFLKTNLSTGLNSIVAGGHSHIIATHIAAEYMVRAGHGLIVSISDHEWDQFYAMQKALMNRLTLSVADELRAYGVTLLSILPGAFFHCFEIMNEEELLSATRLNPNVAKCHTPRLIGRGVVALAADPKVVNKSGKLLELKELIDEYGFTDIDGRQTGEMW